LDLRNGYYILGNFYGGEMRQLTIEHPSFDSLSTEVRVTDPKTGGQKGRKPDQLGAVDPVALLELARLAGAGAEKYSRYNYLKGFDWSLSVDALFRHLLAWLSGQDRDPETGVLHTTAVAWHAHCLTSFQLRKLGTDDRAPSIEPHER
jgi:hypothetical protein